MEVRINPTESVCGTCCFVTWANPVLIRQLELVFGVRSHEEIEVLEVSKDGMKASIVNRSLKNAH